MESENEEYKRDAPRGRHAWALGSSLAGLRLNIGVIPWE